MTLLLFELHNRQHSDDIDSEAHEVFVVLHEPLLAVAAAADVLKLVDAVKQSLIWENSVGTRPTGCRWTSLTKR